MRRLSRYDIELIARRIVKAYWNLPEVQNDDFLRVNPELMATQVLDLNIDYEHLSLDGKTLGLTAFGEVGVEVSSTNTLICNQGATTLCVCNDWPVLWLET